MPKDSAKPQTEQTPESKLKTTYGNLFHEMQFRATKNALMNYHQAEIYEEKGAIWKKATSVLTGASATSLLAGLAQTGKILTNKMGKAGLIGLPVCGLVQLASSSTSEVIPSYTERARKHVAAAAGWMRVAETARTEQLRMKVDPTYEVERVIKVYEELIQRKESISKEVLIPRDAHKHFNLNPEIVYLAIAKRAHSYKDFLELEVKHKNSVTQVQEAEDIYF